MLVPGRLFHKKNCNASRWFSASKDALLSFVFYIANDSLRNNLLELCNILLGLKSNDAKEVMGWPDNLKLRSCMTLFAEAEPEYAVFQKVLDKFFSREKDEKTLEILRKQRRKA